MYCNRCGSVEHFGGQCPGVGPITEVPKRKKVDGSSEVGERMVAKLPPLVAENRLSSTARKRRWRDNNREKYNNYMREYMRKRRAGS